MREEQDQTERSHVRFLGELKWVDIELFAIQSNIKSHFISVHFITKIFQHKVKENTMYTLNIRCNLQGLKRMVQCNT